MVEYCTTLEILNKLLSVSSSSEQTKAETHAKAMLLQPLKVALRAVQGVERLSGQDNFKVR